MIGNLCIAVALMGAAPGAAGEGPRPLLHGLFTDHMVLQRDVLAPVWGHAEPGRRVKVEMAGKSAGATAGPDGKWAVKLGPFAAGGPHTLTVSASEPVKVKGDLINQLRNEAAHLADGPETVTLKGVLVGDVWICSGQSNMEWAVANSNDAEAEIKAADHPRIRLYTVPKRVASEPKEDVSGRWEPCSPETVGGFSAVGYFFGRDLQKELDVPIGLINSSWGGTVAEAWTSGEALATMDDFRPAVAELKEQAAEAGKGPVAFEKRMADWWRKNDPGTSEAPGWADPKLDAASWKAMELPQHWEQAGLADFDGLVWFRKEFDLPESLAGKPLTLHLGPIDDRDTTFVNGVEVGHADQWLAGRDYKVPAGLAKAGRNVVAVRVLDTGGEGGIFGKPADLRLDPPDEAGVASISLAGPWQYRVAAPLAKLATPPSPPGENPNTVTVLFNGMIAPLAPFAIEGAIWYQGESNSGRPEQYRRLLPTMIGDWRARFGVGEFPFFIVSLANLRQRHAEPAESQWAELREAQWLTSRAVPKAGVAMAIDIGEANDIHPRNKQEVGRRLALNALALAHGKDVEYSGPTFRAAEPKGDALRLSFDHAGGLAVKGGGALKGFAVAGEDGRFAWAEATLDGDAVVVSSPKVPHPVAARYAWADNPECNLTNKAGLPAVPFRTDAPKN